MNVGGGGGKKITHLFVPRSHDGSLPGEKVRKHERVRERERETKKRDGISHSVQMQLTVNC